MKTTILLVIFCAFLSFEGMGQGTGLISVEKKGMKKIYLQNKQSLNAKQLAEVLNSDPASARELKASKTNSIISLASMTVGTVWIAGGLVYTIKAAQATNEGDLSGSTSYTASSSACLLLGALFYGASIPFIVMSNSHLNKSISLYNENAGAGAFRKIEMDLGMMDYGVGMRLRF